jgi:hypothetical protein
MPANIESCVFNPSNIGNYIINSNTCNAFSVGNIGDNDDFYVYGAPIEEETLYPLISCNYLNNKGKTLFTLVRNVITDNPGNCKKVNLSGTGYEIANSKGETVLKIQINFNDIKIGKINVLIFGDFYNKNGELVFNSGELNKLHLDCGFVLGISGNSFGYASGLTKLQDFIIKVFIGSRGKVNQILTGKIDNTELQLDGKFIHNAIVEKCKIQIDTGEFIIHGKDNVFTNCHFGFSGLAGNLRQLVLNLRGGDK